LGTYKSKRVVLLDLWFCLGIHFDGGRGSDPDSQHLQEQIFHSVFVVDKAKHPGET